MAHDPCVKARQMSKIIGTAAYIYSFFLLLVNLKNILNLIHIGYGLYLD